MQEMVWEVVWNWSPAALTPCFFYVCVWGGLFFVLILLAPSAAHVHISAEQMVVQRGQIISKWATTTTVRTSCFIEGAGKIVQNELSPLEL